MWYTVCLHTVHILLSASCCYTCSSSVRLSFWRSLRNFMHVSLHLQPVLCFVTVLFLGLVCRLYMYICCFPLCHIGDCFSVPTPLIQTYVPPWNLSFSHPSTSFSGHLFCGKSLLSPGATSEGPSSSSHRTAHWKRLSVCTFLSMYAFQWRRNHGAPGAGAPLYIWDSTTPTSFTSSIREIVASSVCLHQTQTLPLASFPGSSSHAMSPQC